MCAPLLCCIWIKIAYFNKKGDYFNKKERFDAQVDIFSPKWTIFGHFFCQFGLVSY
tara:strand:+ start:279 stop:446 length:168 start_codon:yes stop_codon:yes gene_type:complete